MFFFTEPAPPKTYTLSLHDALPISPMGHEYCGIVEEVGSAVRSIKPGQFVIGSFAPRCRLPRRDRKSTRLNSSHITISYAVICLKKKRLGGGRRSEDARSRRRDARQ